MWVKVFSLLSNQIYLWPEVLISIFPSWFWNFIWNGDIYINQTKKTTISWTIWCLMHNREVLVLGPLLRIVKLAWSNYAGISIRRRIGPKFFLLGWVHTKNEFIIASVSFILSNITNTLPQVKANINWHFGDDHLIRFLKKIMANWTCG